MYVADVQPFYTHGKSVDLTGKLLDIHMLYMTQRASFNLFKALNLDILLVIPLQKLLISIKLYLR